MSVDEESEVRLSGSEIASLTASIINFNQNITDRMVAQDLKLMDCHNKSIESFSHVNNKLIALTSSTDRRSRELSRTNRPETSNLSKSRARDLTYAEVMKTAEDGNRLIRNVTVLNQSNCETTMETLRADKEFRLSKITSVKTKGKCGLTT